MKKFIKEYGSYILIIILVILIRTFLITPIRVNGTSMNNTLYEGEIMFLYKIGNIEREDIVVVSKEVEGSRIIKRVIGMPGETIKCEEGIIYINGEKYDDKYAYGITSDFPEVHLTDKQYYILGDNRFVSMDSRAFGPVEKKYILGTANFVLFPFNKIRKVD